MESISPDIAKKLLTRDFTNLVGRVQKGGDFGDLVAQDGGDVVKR